MYKKTKNFYYSTNPIAHVWEGHQAKAPDHFHLIDSENFRCIPAG